MRFTFFSIMCVTWQLTGGVEYNFEIDDLLGDQPSSNLNDYNHDGKLNACYFCDQTCQESIADVSCYDSTEEFFEDLTSRANDLLETLNNVASVELNFFKVIKPDVVVPLSEYKTENGTNSLSTACANFWTTRYDGQKTLFNKLQDVGCEVAYFTSDRSDPVFYEAGYLGVSYPYGACREYGVSVLKLVAYAPQWMTTLIAHQTAHFLGIYHDAGLASTFLRPATYQNMQLNYPDELASLEQHCVESGPVCRGYNERCVMQMRWTNDFPNQFTDCSRAYFQMTLALSQDWSFFNTDCWRVQDQQDSSKRKKRSISSDELEDESISSLEEFEELREILPLDNAIIGKLYEEDF